MYEPHQAFDPPDDPGAIVWRYIDLQRFLSLLATRALYLCRADRLGDPLEGTITKATVESYADPRSPTFLPAFQESLKQLRASFRRNVAISCWHLAEFESNAMWAQYAERGSGIAIRSTFARLTDSLSEWDHPIHVGCVRYVDYDTAPVGNGNLISPFVHKRREFASEREIRVIASQIPSSQVQGVSVIDHSVSFPDGLLAPIEVSTLVEQVVLAPKAPQWHIDTMRSVINALGYSIPVVRSSLDRDPLLG